MRSYSARLIRCLSLSMALVLSATPLVAKDVGSRVDSEADFSQYRTFHWELPDKPRGPRVSEGGDLDLLIRQLVTDHLEGLGLTHREQGGSDLILTYDAAAVAEMDMEMVRYNISSNVAWVVQGSTSSFEDGQTSRTYFEGTLVLSIHVPDREEPLWSAWTTERLKNNRKVPKKVTGLVEKLLDRLPDFD